jgi:5-methylcytosine-specific restriction endonuclease McrA
MKNIILLNADMSPLKFISFERAINLYLDEKVFVLEQDEKTNFIHPMVQIKYPIKVVLRKYVHVPYKRLKLSRKNIFLRDGYVCQYCRKQLKEHDATIDHVIPKTHRWFPGNGLWENLVTCCKKCNNKKDNKTPDEANMQLLQIPYKPNFEDLVRNFKR